MVFHEHAIPSKPDRRRTIKHAKALRSDVTTKVPPAPVDQTYVEALGKLKAGERIVVSDRFLDWLQAHDDQLMTDWATRVRTIPNPNRLGLLDKYVASFCPMTEGRPAWMNTDVVDPVWVKEHSSSKYVGPKAEPVMDPASTIMNVIQEHLKDVFHPKAVYSGDKAGYKGSPGPRNLAQSEQERLTELVTKLALSLVHTVNNGLEDFYRTGKTPKGFVQEHFYKPDEVPTVGPTGGIGLILSDDELVAEDLFNQPLTEFITAIPRLMEDIHDCIIQSDALPITGMIRGLWEEWIVAEHQDSTIYGPEILQQGIDMCSESELRVALERAGFELPYDDKGIIHVG